MDEPRRGKTKLVHHQDDLSSGLSGASACYMPDLGQTWVGISSSELKQIPLNLNAILLGYQTMSGLDFTIFWFPCSFGKGEMAFFQRSTFPSPFCRFGSIWMEKQKTFEFNWFHNGIMHAAQLHHHSQGSQGEEIPSTCASLGSCESSN